MDERGSKKKKDIKRSKKIVSLCFIGNHYIYFLPENPDKVTNETIKNQPLKENFN
jgi:hypothetical protein